MQKPPTDKRNPISISITIIGCGYIGRLLARRLSDNDHTVNATVRSEASRELCRSDGIDCDSIDLDELRTTIDLSAKRVIYLAPPPSSGKQDPRMTNFLSAIEAQPPERFVLISTTGVYGNCDGDWIDETQALNPKADRAYRRVDAEQQAQQFCEHHDIPLVILRVAGIYGPGKVPVQRIESGQPIVREADSPFTNRIHAHDLVRICETALLDDAITGIYNVTDGHPGTMYEYFMGVASTLGLPAPPAISLEEARSQLSAGMLSYMAESRRLDNSKLLKDFQLSLRYPTLKDGLTSLS